MTSRWPREILRIRRSTEPARQMAKQYAPELGITARVITAIRARRMYPLATQAEVLAAWRESFNQA